MGGLFKGVSEATKRERAGIGRTGESGFGFEGSTQYTGKELGKWAANPSRSGKRGQGRLGGAKTPLSSSQGK